MAFGSERRLDAIERRLEQLHVPRDIQAAFSRYVSDPVAFATEILGVTTMPEYQEEFLRSVAANERVAWVGGHATGKSVAAAILLAWYMVTRPGSRCIVTSATFERQVGRVIFAKLRSLVAKAKERLPIEVYATRAIVAETPEWSAEGVPASSPANFSGFHAPQMLVVVDEAKAVERPAYEELLGNLASAVDEFRLVLVSTAGPASGYFYERFERHEDTWALHRTPSTDSPFARGYAELMREECYGEDDPVYRMRVGAEFASDVEGQLIPLAAIQGAIGRVFDDDKDKDAGTVLGVDLARFGEDRSVVCVRRGRTVTEIVVWRQFDLMMSAVRVASEMHARLASARIDSAGLGAGVYDRLKELEMKNVEPVNVGSRSSKPQTFVNLRAELGWHLRGQFERGDISIPDRPDLVSELVALRYGYDAAGRIKLEPKADAKRRLGRSPDLADSLLLTGRGFAEPFEVLIARADLIEDAFGDPIDGRAEPWQPGMREF